MTGKRKRIRPLAHIIVLNRADAIFSSMSCEYVRSMVHRALQYSLNVDHSFTNPALILWTLHFVE
jgi:hypothetical protein